MNDKKNRIKEWYMDDEKKKNGQGRQKSGVKKYNTITSPSRQQRHINTLQYNFKKNLKNNKRIIKIKRLIHT